MKRILLLMLFASLMLSLPTIARKLTQGFRLVKLRCDFPANSEWDFALPSSLHAILSQPFHYLGKGSQSYVFESADKQYVVKLFRFDRKHQLEKYLHLFEACKIAYEHLREETGLIYVHLNPTAIDFPIFRGKDAMGRRIQIPLNQARFVVQKRGHNLEEVLRDARHNPQVMRNRLKQFFDLLQARAAKGVFNKDPSLKRNFGFLEDQAIEFDFGSYRFDPTLDRAKEVQRYGQKLRHWLIQNAPEWVFYFDLLKLNTPLKI